MGIKKPEIGKSSSLNALRDYLQDDCFMLQVWGGKTEEMENFQIYLSQNLEFFSVIKSDADDDLYTVIVAGDVTYVHEKNLLKIQKMMKKNREMNREDD